MSDNISLFSQIPLHINLRDDTNFQNFYSQTQQPFLQYLQEAIIGKHEKYFFLWGRDGVGKTHLLQACCHYAAELNFKSVYIPLQKHKELSPEILHDLETIEIICLDDISYISGNAEWEEALFHLYNRVMLLGHRMILADKKCSKDIPFNLRDLHSRIEAIPAFEILELNDHEKILVLQKRAFARGFELSNEVAEFLIHRLGRSLTNLFAILNKLDHASLSAKRKLTIPFVKVVLGM